MKADNSLGDVAKLYQMLSEFDPAELTDQLVSQVPILNGSMLFFGQKKVDRLLHCDDATLAKVLGIPGHLRLHPCLETLPLLVDRLGVRRLSRAVCTELHSVRLSTESPALTLRFRAAFRWLQKFCLLQDEGAFVDHGRLDAFIANLKVGLLAGWFLFSSLF